MYRMLFLVLVSFILISCGGGSSETSGDNKASVVVSSGLKIFVTKETHVGDFYNDPTLEGITSIDKADQFCNESISKPSDAVYKALLVDGIDRDAISLTNWVFEPSTDYYRAYDNLKIGKTDSNSILTAFWSDLDNSINDCDYQCGANSDFGVWTGIEDAGNFSAMNNTCDSWASSNISDSGRFGDLAAKDGFAFSHPNGVAACNIRMHIYCVEQK